MNAPELPEIGSEWKSRHALANAYTEVVTGHGEMEGEPAVLFEMRGSGKRIGSGRSVISHWVETREPVNTVVTE